MNKDYKLFIDLDGVIVDFEGGYRKLSGGKTIKEISDKEGKIAAEKKYFRAGVDFWANLEWEHGGKELWEASSRLFEHVYILSSAGTTDKETLRMVKTGKRLWIKRNIPTFDQKNVLIVSSKHLKKNYASKISILVDDMPITIKEFIQQGGYGILHNSKDYKKTIEELEDISRPIKISELARRFFWKV